VSAGCTRLFFAASYKLKRLDHHALGAGIAQFLPSFGGRLHRFLVEHIDDAILGAAKQRIH
jgi:hypothetical protein